MNWLFNINWQRVQRGPGGRSCGGLLRRFTTDPFGGRRLGGLLLAALAAALLGTAAWSAQCVAAEVVANQDRWVNQTIIVTARGDVPLREGTRTVDKVDELTGVVKKTQGDWVYVVMNDGRKGWLQKNQVVTLAAAEQFFTAQIRRNPSDAEAYYRRGFARMHNDQLSRAMADCNEAIRLQPRTAPYYNGRGNVWLEMDDADRALADYNAAIRFAPVHAFYYKNAGVARMRKGEYEQAIANFTRAIELKPEYVRAYAARAAAWEEQGEYLKAYSDYSKAMQLDPDDEMLMVSRIFVAMDLAEVPDDELRAFQPRDLEEYADRGWAWLQKGKLAQAESDYTSVVGLQPTVGFWLNQRGWVRYLRGNDPGALDDFNAAIRYNPDTSGAYLNRGLVRLREANYSAAIADFDSAIRLEKFRSDQAVISLNRAWAHYKQGDFAAAIADFHAPFGTDNPRWNFNLVFNTGWSKAVSNPAIPDEAAAANQLAAPDAFVLAWRGQANAFDKQTELALADLNRAIETDPKFALPYFLRAQIRAKEGNTEAARADLDRALELYPEYAVARHHRDLMR